MRGWGDLEAHQRHERMLPRILGSGTRTMINEVPPKVGDTANALFSHGGRETEWGCLSVTTFKKDAYCTDADSGMKHLV